MEPLHPSKSSGGSAGNTIKALAALGGDCTFVGKVGQDDDARLLDDIYHRMGAETRFLHSTLHTGVASTFISPTGERTFGTCLGAASTLQASEVTPELLEGIDWLHIEGYLVQDHALIEHIGKLARQAGVHTSMDLASYNVLLEDLDFARHLVKKYVDVVFANEDEASVFTGGLDALRAAEKMASMCTMAVVKMGEYGSLVYCDKWGGMLPAQRVPVVDTTGAGDFFAAGFLYALIHGGGCEQCLHCGTELAAQVIQVVGTDLTAEGWQACRDAVNKILGA